VSEPRKEKCIWCAGDDGALTTVEVPVDTEIPAGEPRLEEVAVHPRHRSEARDYCFEAARYVKRDFFIVIGMPVLVAAAIPLGQLLAGPGGSERAWSIGIIGSLLALNGAYVIRFPHAYTPRRMSLLIGGLKRGRQIVRLGGVAGTLFGLAVLALAFA